MQMNRLNLYQFVHTTVRGQLSQLMIQAGKTIYSNPEEVLSLHKFICDVAAFLRSHSEHEDTCIHPKIKEKNFSKMSEIEIEHDTIEAQLEILILQITAINDIFLKSVCKDEISNTKKQEIKQEGNEFCLNLAKFIASYFNHMNAEEKEIMPFLWKTLSDDEILSIEMKVRTLIPEEKMLTMIPMMYPYINYEEALKLTEILKNLSNFKDIAIAIEKCLPSECSKR